MSKRSKEVLVINTKAFGNKIREARKQFGYTQLELSEILKVSPNFLGDIERGKKLSSLNKTIMIANELKIGLDYLFSESLDNQVKEPDEIYFTDKQLHILSNFVKQIIHLKNSIYGLTYMLFLFYIKKF